MKTLHLLRHAKAVEGNPHTTDHARELSKRGVKGAKALAAHLLDNPFPIDRTFCSTSTRTRQTYELIAASLGKVPVSYRDRLYLIDFGDLMGFVQGLPDTTTSILVIGHNPAFHMAVLALAKGAAPGHSDDIATLKEKYPAGALCSLEFDTTHWRQVKAGTGLLTRFLRPRDLEDE